MDYCNARLSIKPLSFYDSFRPKVYCRKLMKIGLRKKWYTILYVNYTYHFLQKLNVLQNYTNTFRQISKRKTNTTSPLIYFQWRTAMG